MLFAWNKDRKWSGNAFGANDRHPDPYLRITMKSDIGDETRGNERKWEEMNVDFQECREWVFVISILPPPPTPLYSSLLPEYLTLHNGRNISTEKREKEKEKEKEEEKENEEKMIKESGKEVRREEDLQRM
jgi:hypothetical protein